MLGETDCIVVGGEVIFEGTSFFVSETGEIAWVAAIKGNHVKIQTVNDSGDIPTAVFRDRIIDEDYIVEDQSAAPSFR